MFRSQNILKATVFFHNKDREKTVSELHKLGILQLIDLKQEKVELSASNSSEDVKEVSDLLLRVSRSVNILKFASPKLNFKQNLFGLDLLDKVKIKRNDRKDLIKKSLLFLKEHESKLLSYEEKYNQNIDQKEQLEDHYKIVDLFSVLDIPISLLKDTKNTVIVSGRIANNKVERLEKELEKELDGFFHLFDKQEDKKNTVIVLVALKEDINKVSFTLKKQGVNTFIVPDVKEGSLKEIEKELESNSKEKKSILSNINKLYKKIFENAVVLREELELSKDQIEAVNNMLESKKFGVLQGWVTEKQYCLLEKELKNVVITKEDAKAEEEPPVRLSNPGFLKPFEILTELYALPKYKDLDPTFVVGPIFLIFAGFMLTDFVYGLGLVVMGLFILFKFSKYSPGLNYICINMTGIGAVSMIFGVLTGSYLGDAPSYFFGIPTAQLAIWKDPLADPLYFLIISIVIAIIHLNIGLIMGLVEDVRKKQWKTLVSERVVWFTLQISLVCIYFKVFPVFGKYLGIATVIAIVVLSGPLGLLSITGFMGDVISYSRLFALALSTAGIAMTVNLLADLLNGVPYVGIFLATLIFIVGHLFSFLMNSLGSFVHSIRLQFVEFFGKFYEGGGDGLGVFKEERVYTKVKE